VTPATADLVAEILAAGRGAEPRWREWAGKAAVTAAQLVERASARGVPDPEGWWLDELGVIVLDYGRVRLGVRPLARADLIDAQVDELARIFPRQLSA
jgi:hypothetical protein